MTLKRHIYVWKAEVVPLKRNDARIREVLQHVILAKKPYERRLRGAVRFSTLSWYVNHVNSGLATVSRRSRFCSYLRRFVVRHDSHLFDLGTQGWEAHAFLCWRKVLSHTRGFQLSRQAKAQQSVAKPKLDVAAGDKSRTCFDT